MKGNRRFVLATILVVALVAGNFAVIPASASAAPAKTNTFAQFLQSQPSSLPHSIPAPSASTFVPRNPVPILRQSQSSLQDGALVVDPFHGGHFVTGDQRFEVAVSPGAVTSADLADAGGEVQLKIRQIRPASGSSAGGSGHVSLGTYLLQVVDRHGRLLGHGLRKPVRLTFHFSQRERALGVSKGFLILNTMVPDGINFNPDPSGAVMTAAAAGVGNPTPVPIVHSSSSGSATVALSSPSTTASYDTDSPVATFGRPDPFNVDLNAGSLTAGYPIDLPKGPGGLTPPLTLGYSSAAVAEQHNPQAAAGWVGEGWNLSLGSISWAEHNGNSGGSSPIWEDSWQLNDPYGTQAELIPPTTTTRITNEDSSNALTASPVAWHTAPDSHTKIISFAPTGVMGEPSAVSWASNRVDTFVRGSDNYLWHRFWDSSSWSAWESVGGPIASDPSAVSWGPNRLDVFVGGTDNALWHASWNGSAWSWESLAGTLVSGPSAISWGANRLDVFIRGSDNYLWHRAYAGSWQAWERVGGPIASDASAVSWGVNRLDAFIRGTDNALWHAWWSGTTWSWESLGGVLVSRPTAISWGANRLDVFIRGSDNDLWHRGYASGWLAWEQVGGPIASDAGAVSWGANRLDAFVQGSDNALWHAWWAGTTWTWESLGGKPASVPAAASQGSGLMDVFAQGTDNGLWHRGYGSAGWGNWDALGSPTFPCFRVFLPNGIMEEYGCTPDSVQFYPGQTGAIYIANWLLDLITDPHGNQVHVTYKRDMAVASSLSYPRDAALSTIEYDAPGCQNAQAACTGSNWAPLVRVNFLTDHTVAHSGGQICAANGSLRCDDPVDLSGSGGVSNPTVQNTWVLNDAQVQVRGSPSANWNTLRTYQLAYDQSAAATITDPVTGKAQSVAGRLNLTQLSEIGDDGTTSLPPRAFSYAAVSEYYEDDQFHPTPSTNCGPSWNTGTGSGCLLWSQSAQGNSYYLATASNGLGLAQIFTWQNARNNTHGVSTGGANNDPLYCNGHQSGYPCNEADDQNWSHAVLTQETGSVQWMTQNGQGGSQTTNPVTGTTAYTYQLTTLTAKPCSDCLWGLYWGNRNDNDYLDYYNGKFMGFSQATVVHPDQATDVHKYYTTDGYGVYDTSQITTCPVAGTCFNAPWWDPSLMNVAHGREYELDVYDTNGTTLLQQTKTQFQAICPPAGVAGSPPLSGFGNFNGNLVSELDHANPVAVCDLHASQVDQYQFDGAASSNAVHKTTAYLYDSYGRVTKQTDTANDGGATGSATTIVSQPAYVWNDAVTATATSATGRYLIDFPSFTDTEDASGNRSSCTYSGYDGQAVVSGASSGLLYGDLTESDRYTSCGTAAQNFNDRSGLLSTTHIYDAYGNSVTTNDPDANAGNAAHKGCVVSGSTYSACTAYDSTFAVLPISHTNALNQTNLTTYQSPGSATAAGGFGLWPIAATDPNSQTTSNGYDALGRLTSQTLPGEGTGLTTTATSYTVWCSGTSAQTPCLEIDRTQRLNSSTTVTSRAFFDGWGHLIETRTPAPNNQDVVRYLYYDTSQRLAFETDAYFVTAYTGSPGSAAYSIPDSTQPGTSHTYDGLGRLKTTTDPLGNQISNTISATCGAISGDTACYEQTLTVDPLGHQGGGLVDAFGRTQYRQAYTGNSPSSYAVYATTKYNYDVNGNLTQILEPDGTSRVTFQYDMAGRQTGMSDPDLGSSTYSYDQDGNLTQSVDARGSAGTVYTGYDGLDRSLWRNSTNSPTGAYQTFAYDSTASGSQGIGRLTSETFTGGPNNSLSGSYSYVYDGRGQQTNATLTGAGTNYPVQTSFDDAGNTLTQTYPTGEVVTTGYTAQGWLSSLNTTQGNTTLLSGAAYSGFGGAAQRLTSASLGGGRYQYTASFDALLRASDLKMANGSTTLFEQTRSFDGADNVTTANTSLPAGTDNQAFCYDEQNRLTWAGAAGTPPCGAGLTPGSLTAAQYTQSFTYDNLGRLTNGPLGGYTYGNSAHLHAATVIGSSWTAAYDAAGDMTCRAPSNASTCAGTQTGTQLTYNSEGSMGAWQNAPSNPSSTAGFLYDNQGNRVEQQVTQGGSTTTTIYVGSLEQIATTGATTTTSTYYYAGSARIALAVNGVVSYLASDGLGSANVALNASGSATASTLYAPYGGPRYSNGTMPTDYGFTGQHIDAATGLDYYNARYYDPLSGQFTSADSVLPGGGFDLLGLSRYAYVEGNPVDRADPSGNHQTLGCEPNCTSLDYAQFRTDQACAFGTASACDNAVSNQYNSLYSLAHAVVTSRDQTANLAWFLIHLYSGNDVPLDLVRDPRPNITVEQGEELGKTALTYAGQVGPQARGVLDAYQSDIAAGLTFAALAGSIRLPPGFRSGAYARESIIASDPWSVTSSQQAAINRLGQKYGCHTCGRFQPLTKSGNWVGDHIPVSRFTRPGWIQRLFPQCLACMRYQGRAAAEYARRGIDPYAGWDDEEER